MVTTLTLPALAFLMAISGLPAVPGAKSLPGLRSLLRHKPKLTAADSLPPQWRPAPRLSIERDILRPGLPPFGTLPASIKFTTGMDPRKVKTRVDPDSGFWFNSVEIGDVRLGAAYRRPLTGFGSATMRERFAERWQDRSRQDVNRLAGSVAAVHTGLQLPIPVQLPPVVSSILGPGGPALNVSGSENIRISGTSDWTNQQTGLLGQRRSLFPSLDMQQDLNIQLEGQLSDRVKVNLLQNSATQVPLSNRIAINYKGDEDDLVQALDLGNTDLALPGTQYVSYSGRNEGLFGVKLAARLGPLDVTTLASKQEGRSERASYTGGASVQKQVLADVEYEKGRYFLLYDPQYGLYQIDDTSIEIFRDDANYGNDINTVKGKAMVDPGGVMGVPPHGSPPDTAFRGRFDKLRLLDDYEILPDFYVFQGGLALKIIRLKQPVNSEMCLAAAYRATPVSPQGTPLGPTFTVGQIGIDVLGAAAGPDSGYKELKMLRAPRGLQKPAIPDNPNISPYDTSAAFDAVRELEMKNFYQLSGFQLDPKSFKLSIQRGNDDPPINYVRLADGTSVNYLETLGLDNYDESASTLVKGHDERVDGSGYQSGARLFVDYTNGVVWFPDPRPFGPRLSGPGARWFDATMDLNLNRRLRLIGPRDSLNGANAEIYDHYAVDRNLDVRYYLVAEFAAQRGGGEITLGRGNVLDGSDVVTVNGERWTRDRDYTVDYDLGRISLKRQLGPTDQLNIDYSYAPLFAQAGKTLLGSAFRLEGRDRSLGGAFLYESRGAQDLRPRLGEEPSRTLITDMNTDYRFKSDFLTRLADRLPGIRTTASSDVNVQAEVGASFPNPNTRNEVYIDDMEGVRDAVTLSLSPERWRWMSVPSQVLARSGQRAIQTRLMTDVPGEHDAEIHWYVPPNVVHEKDLKPSLTDAQGARNPRQVLALSVPRSPASGAPGDRLWTGLTYQLDDRGIDLSRSQFIELWVNDFNDHHDPAQPQPLVRGQHLKLRLDLGVVSEDQMRAPNRPPNGDLPQSEDRNNDNQLTVTPGNDEDTGYDGISDEAERAALNAGTLALADLTTASDSDPEGDDFADPDNTYHDIDPRKFIRTNGTENSKKVYPYPDTEDLNLDRILNTDERYFEYTIDLGDPASPYLVTDLQALGGVGIDNGWRRYRVPIGDSLRVQFGVPDLTIARHVRMWVDSLAGPEPTTASERHPLLMIGSVDIVGSRWLSSQLTPLQKDTLHTTLTLNSVNTVDNADVYRPPFDPGQTLNGSQSLTRREQSMSMEFEQLAAGDTLEAYRTFSIDENYSRYGALRWYAASFDVEGYDATRDTSLYYFVRFASDERGENYYEIKRRLPAVSPAIDIHWQEERAVLEELSNVKLSPPDFPANSPVQYTRPLPGGAWLTVRGRPSFTRLRRISFGLLNEFPGDAFSGRSFPHGQLWFDEIRATDIAKDVGLASRLLLGGHVADLLGYNVSWNSRDADFLSVGETRGSGSRTSNLAVTSQFNTQAFFAGSGINLPVSFVYNQSESKPRFSAGDDVTRTGAQQDASKTLSQTRTMSTNYSRVWSQRANPLLRYTIGGISGAASRTQSDNTGPGGMGRSLSTTASANYQVAPRALAKIPLPFTTAAFYPLPEQFHWNYNLAQSRSTQWSRPVDDPTRLQLSSDVGGRTASLDVGADSRPIDMLSHHIEAHRALSLSNVPLDHVGFVNFGRTTNWRQNFSSRYSFHQGNWIQPSMTWSSNFSSNADLQSQNLSVHSYTNGQNAQVSWTLPFSEFAGLNKVWTGNEPVAPKSAADSTAKVAKRRTHRFLWRRFLSQIGAVGTDFTVSRSSGYTRLTGMPNLLYLTGLSSNPGLADTTHGVRPAAGNTFNTGADWRANISARIPLMFESAISTRMGFGDHSGSANGVISRTADSRWPDLDVAYGKVADAIRMTRFIKNPQLRTSWVRSSSTDYLGSRANKVGHSQSDDFHPLLSLRGTLKSGAQVDLSTNVRNTRREVYQYGTSLQTDNNTDLNLTISRSYSQGQKVSFLGKTSTVRSSVSLQLATVYSHRSGETRVPGIVAPTRLVDDSRLSVTGTGTYGFSANVSGSAVLGFSQTHDNTLNIVRRSVRVELRAQFGF